MPNSLQSPEPNRYPARKARRVTKNASNTGRLALLYRQDSSTINNLCSTMRSSNQSSTLSKDDHYFILKRSNTSTASPYPPPGQYSALHNRAIWTGDMFLMFLTRHGRDKAQTQ
ncbi:unnamed protein product [Ectocarpus fasciculatus]